MLSENKRMYTYITQQKGLTVKLKKSPRTTSKRKKRKHKRIQKKKPQAV